ncbi:DEAD/DEAH box helicase family protein [Streptomyces sp. NPDC049590]|uniref:DEAD/DEAH box helicase family protein n=1 Tax=Streptomyces sp. NPDC049590 TaxID=3154834 RepID=UPI00344856E4
MVTDRSHEDARDNSLTQPTPTMQSPGQAKPAPPSGPIPTPADLKAAHDGNVRAGGGLAARGATIAVGNFVFLQEAWATLYDDARKAERLAHADPRASAFYSRFVLEQAVEWMYRNDRRLVPPYKMDLNAMTKAPSFKQLVTPGLIAKMDLVRINGNRAVHKPAPVPVKLALDSLRELFHLLYWFARSYTDSGRHTLPPSDLAFDLTLVPRPLSPQAHQAKQQELLKQKRQQEKDLQERWERLEAANEELKRQLEEARRRIADITQQNKQIPDIHDYDEEATREAFIDVLLREAGWENFTRGKDIEYEVDGMPTKSGRGRVDYVLWGDDGKPLALVEAKRTRLDAREGQEQARLYANALEARFNRRPVIFYTNGYETYLWDDAREINYPPRRIQGFLTKKELLWRIQQRARRRSLLHTPVNEDIAGRPYQKRAIARVGEAFEKRQREALLVMATGTGKTRTTAALTDVLQRAGWVQRALFLADREALVTQAKRAFDANLKQTPTVNLLEEKKEDARVYFSTYQTMMNLIGQTDADGHRRFGPGFFDLIVIDEAHRSVYDKYRWIFEYFDSLLLGLTATPKNEIDRNTFRLFQLEDGVPTDFYDLDDAVREGYLVPPVPIRVPLKFMELGIRYASLSDEEKAEWDSLEWSEDGRIPDSVSANELNKYLFNTDTVDKMLETLMTYGIKVEGGDRLGKTIVFARSNDHARFIEKRFNANYPQYGGKKARVITYKEKRAQALLDAFADPKPKNPDDAPDIAISVDMLDTGVDVPEVVNLVFAKPVYSKTKFWQMMGRGTRLRPALFGPDPDNPEYAKKNFQVFDFCGNLAYFSADLPVRDGRTTLSLAERTQVRQLELIRALDRRTPPDPARDAGADAYATEQELRWSLAHRLHCTVSGMSPEHNVLVRPHRREVERFSHFTAWRVLDDEADHLLRSGLLGLPSEWREEGNNPGEEARRFDLKAYELQLAALEGSRDYARRRAEMQQIAENLLGKRNIPDVEKQAELLSACAGDEWWQDVTLPMLEDLRRRLRPLVKLIDPPTKRKIVYTDFEDELGVPVEMELPGMQVGTDIDRFRAKTRAYLDKHPDNPAVHKLTHNEQITADDLKALEKAFLDDGVASSEDLEHVVRQGPGLGLFVRSISGLDRAAAQQAFEGFTSGRQLSSQQWDFLNLIVDALTKRGYLEPQDLFRSPFTDRFPKNLFGYFSKEEAAELKVIVTELRKRALPTDLAA